MTLFPCGVSVSRDITHTRLVKKWHHSYLIQPEISRDIV